ncbi:hypothetical protein C5E16_01070 [Clavibacter michiganensis]|uniref:Uncharacterized protein n=1 Tax=Clavibacter michiganensis TaxID=28447 RepID=A0A2S5VYN7_9MICO|nr:hypothetical protein [Clavibacter michiganensis]PPF71433.1 hypothetical protein C5E16_01070 [Clavibacter michiganensis]
MTPSHDAPDTGPTSFDDGPAPQTLGLSRREMRAAERARALALGIDEADDAPADLVPADAPDPRPDTSGPGAGPDSDSAVASSSDGAASEDAAPDASVSVVDAPGDAPQGEAPAPESARASDQVAAAPDAAAVPPASSGVGPETSAILLSGGVLTRRQLRAIREAEEAARQQRGSEHEGAPGSPSATPSAPSGDADAGGDGAADGDAAATGGRDAVAVDDAPPAGSGASVPPYVRYGRGSRATPRPRAPYGSAYRRPADVEAEAVPAQEAEEIEAVPVEDADADRETEAPERSGTPSAETPSAWPFAPIVPSGDAAGRDVDSSGEQPTVPPLAAHTPSRDEDPRPAPSLEPASWATGPASPSLEPAFGTRASAASEDLEGVDPGDRAAEPTGAAAAAADVRTPFTPPTGHWSVQDQVDEDQPHTGNHFILPTVPHAGDMQQALNSTGEIIITGSIDLPRSLGSMGTHPDRFDTADMDRILEQGDDHDHAPAGSDSEPVRASRAVSTHTSTRAVVQPPPRKRFTAPVVAAVTAGGVAVIGAGLVIVAFMTNVF